MKNNIDDKNNLEGDFDNNLNWLTPDEIVKKFDAQMDRLRKIAREEAIENESEKNDWNKIDMIDEFFDKSEYEDNNNRIETQEIHEKKDKKYANIVDRNIKVQEIIKASWNNVLSSIEDWKEQKNLVTKTLLRVANRIMNTEK